MCGGYIGFGFVVERIVDVHHSKTDETDVKYLIKWKGWADRYNSWEPRASILDAALIAAASGSECAICFEDPAQLLVFLPCGHRCVCDECGDDREAAEHDDEEAEYFG